MVFVLIFCILNPPIRNRRWQDKMISSYEWKLTYILSILDDDIDHIEDGRVKWPSWALSNFLNSFISPKEQPHLIKKLRLDGYLHKDDPPRITIEGSKFLFNKGYMRTLTNQQNEDKKLKYDAITAKWKYLTFWIAFAVSVISAAIAIYISLRCRC